MLFIYYTVDLELINDLDLGLELIGYADDNTLISNGTVKGKELENNINLVLEIISYIICKKKLKMELSKQKYMIFSDKQDYKENYLNIVLNKEKVNKVYDSISYLGLILDVNLNWESQINMVANNMRRVYFLIYDKFKYADDLLACWLPLLYQSLVISRMLYGIEFWSMSKSKSLNKIKKIYNDIIRVCTGSELSTRLCFQLMVLDWIGFDELLIQKKAIYWSRLIRSPNTNIINKRINQFYWNNWLKIRNNDKISIFDGMEDNNLVLHNININEILIENDIGNNPLMASNWNYKDWDNLDINMDNLSYSLFNESFLAAKDLKTSDYVFMKNMYFADIPKRSSFYYGNISRPVNLNFHHLDENNIQLSYNNDWCKDFILKNNLDMNRVQIVMTDGSVKNGIGGCGFFSNFDYYLNNLNLTELRLNKYIDSDKVNYNELVIFVIILDPVVLDAALNIVN